MYPLLVGKLIYDFYPRSPCGERLRPPGQGAGMVDISIHALLAESDAIGRLHWIISCYFYPRSPCGERRTASLFAAICIMISIHALLAESDVEPQLQKIAEEISIHALLAESDPQARRVRLPKP